MLKSFSSQRSLGTSASQSFLLLLFLGATYLLGEPPPSNSLGSKVQNFSQVAVNEGSMTSFTVHNPSETDGIDVDVQLYNSDGSDLASQAVALGPGATDTVTFGDKNEALTRGWAKLTGDANFIATEFFQLSTDSPRVGVLPSVAAEQIKFLGSKSDDYSTGLAVHNPDPHEETQVTIRFKNQDGESVGTSNLALGPFESVASFLEEFLPGLGNFNGAVEITAVPYPVAALALGQQNGDVTTISVVTPGLPETLGEVPSSNTPGITVNIAASSRQLRLTDVDNDKYWQLSSTSNGLAFKFQEDQNDEALALWLNSFGNVGIGTKTPARRLEVASGDQDGIRISSSGIPQLELVSEIDPSHLWKVFIDPSEGEFGIFDKLAADTRLLIDSSGNVGIGTTSPTSRLHVKGTGFFSGGVTSSRKLKQNISSLTHEEALTTLDNLDPIKFTFKSDTEKDLQLGFIAEDVPDLVSTPGRKGIQAMDLIAVLTKVVQERRQRISSLEEQLQDREAQMDALETRLEALERLLELEQ